MERKIEKIIKQEEYIVVMNNLLELLYMHYRENMSKDVEMGMLNFMKILQKEYTKEYPKNYDIVDCDIFEKITFQNTRNIK